MGEIKGSCFITLCLENYNLVNSKKHKLALNMTLHRKKICALVYWTLFARAGSVHGVTSSKTSPIFPEVFVFQILREFCLTDVFLLESPIRM